MISKYNANSQQLSDSNQGMQTDSNAQTAGEGCGDTGSHTDSRKRSRSGDYPPLHQHQQQHQHQHQQHHQQQHQQQPGFQQRMSGELRRIKAALTPLPS